MNARLLIALLVIAMPVLGAGVHFPSGAISESPDGRWKLTCKRPPESAADLEPVLLLTESQGRGIELRRIDRGCSILWSPDSSWFALTDDWASDSSDVFIYSAAGHLSKKSIGEQFPTNAIPQAELAGHCYFEAREWLDRHRLRFEVSGHTDEPPIYSFEHEYVFDLASGRFEKAMAEKPDKAPQPKAAAPKAP
jgi:hypothetical protein